MLTGIDKYLGMGYKGRYKPVTNLLTTIMDKPIGGRGKKAPYETTHVRIPVDLKPQVELLIKEFRDNGCVVKGDTIDNIVKNSLTITDDFIQKMIQEFKNNDMFIVQESDEVWMGGMSLKLDKSIEIANKLLATRGTRKEVVTKLLTALFDIEVEL